MAAAAGAAGAAEACCLMNLRGADDAALHDAAPAAGTVAAAMGVRLVLQGRKLMEACPRQSSPEYAAVLTEGRQLAAQVAVRLDARPVGARTDANWEHQAAKSLHKL